MVLRKRRCIMDVESGIAKKPALDVTIAKVIYLSAPSRKAVSIRIQLQNLADKG